jgi:hypothetical protein
MSRSLLMWVFLVAAATAPCAAAAAERVGETVRVSLQVSGQAGALARGDAIHRDERLRSNSSGTGAFIFEDGTKLAIGPNSSIVIDEFVYRGGARVEKLVLGAGRGTFRWISGKSDHSAYKIKTPSGALSVRGTAFDVFVGEDGLTAVTLLSGGAEFCTSQGCERLTRRCEFLLARPNGTITRPKGVVRDLGAGRPAEDVFPFLTGNAGLPPGFKANSSCAGLSREASGPGGNGAPQQGKPARRSSQPSSDSDSDKPRGQ